MMHWIRPEWLWLLLGVVPLIWYLWQSDRAGSSWHHVCDEALLKHLLVRPEVEQTSGHYVLWLLFLLLGIVALAGPSFNKKDVPVFKNTQSVVVVQSLAPSMWVKDVLPDRLARSKFKLQDMLIKYRDGAYGLIVFAKDAHVVSPVTEDRQIILEMVQTLSPDMMPLPGSNIATALNKAVELSKHSGTDDGMILLVTAGPVTSSDFKAAAQVKASGLTFAIIGVGTKQGAPMPDVKGFKKDEAGHVTMVKLDEQGLLSLAKAGGGTYVHMSHNDSDLDLVLDQVSIVCSIHVLWMFF